MTDIACGDAHSAAIAEDGQLFMWGSSDNNKLGFAEVVNTDKERPMLQEFFLSMPVK